MSQTGHAEAFTERETCSAVSHTGHCVLILSVSIPTTQTEWEGLIISSVGAASASVHASRARFARSSAPSDKSQPACVDEIITIERHDQDCNAPEESAIIMIAMGGQRAERLALASTQWKGQGTAVEGPWEASGRPVEIPVKGQENQGKVRGWSGAGKAQGRGLWVPRSSSCTGCVRGCLRGAACCPPGGPEVWPKAGLTVSGGIFRQRKVKERRWKGSERSKKGSETSKKGGGQAAERQRKAAKGHRKAVECPRKAAGRAVATLNWWFSASAFKDWLSSDLRCGGTQGLVHSSLCALALCTRSVHNSLYALALCTCSMHSVHESRRG